MTLKSTPCTCTASALAVFIRRVAHIDLVSAIRHTNDIRPLFVARRNISTFHRLQSQGTSPHETVNSTSYAAANLEDSIPFDQAHPNCKPSSLEPRLRPLRSSTVDNVDEGRWAVGDLEKKHTVSSSDSLVPCDRGQREAVGYINVHTKSYAAQRMWEARPNRSPVSMRGFTLHYSSPPVPTTPKAREAQKRNPTTPESQVPDSAIVDHHRSPVAEREHWQIQKAALKEKFKEGWNPRKKLSPDALAGIRAVHAQFPEQYTTSVLAEKFEVSPEAIRRILKSRWTPKEEEALDRQRRWFLRGQKVWSRYAELGLKPPARWRKLGIGKKDGLATSRSLRQSADTNVTMRSADYAVRESDETFSSTSASMAERIL